MKQPHIQILSSIRLNTGARLQRKLVKQGTCLVFTGTKNKAGYGFVPVMIKGKRFPILAHRLAWVLHHLKEPPEGQIICHRCNNPSCCNPKHLYAGTPATNAADMIAAGHQVSTLLGVKGTAHPASTYSQEVKHLAVQMHRNGSNFNVIAKKIGCGRDTVSRWWDEFLSGLASG